MLFLILQMSFLLLIAIAIGVILGWWLNKLKSRQAILEATPTLDATQGEQFTLKNQLNKCFEDNSVLRRELKSCQETLAKSKGGKAATSVKEGDLQEKINVLMDDLQIRDDMIAALNKEIEQLKQG